MDKLHFMPANGLGYTLLECDLTNNEYRITSREVIGFYIDPNEGITRVLVDPGFVYGLGRDDFGYLDRTLMAPGGRAGVSFTPAPIMRNGSKLFAKTMRGRKGNIAAHHRKLE